jgi:hypothetical protein
VLLILANEYNSKISKAFHIGGFAEDGAPNGMDMGTVDKILCLTLKADAK